MREVFDQYIYSTFGEEKQAEGKFSQFDHNYKAYFPVDKNTRVLDVGIGRGEMLTCMHRWGYRNYLGIDISPSTIRYCKSLDLNCELVTDTVEWLTNHQNTFGLITLIDVLEHIPKSGLIGILKALKATLVNKGVLIIQVPNMQAPDSQVCRYGDITHECGFTEHSLGQLLLTVGFSRYIFGGFEDQRPDSLRRRLKRSLRRVLWGYVKCTRRICGNLNPDILHPVLYCIARKGK